MKYRDEILQPPLSLPTHMMEGKLKIFGRNYKFEEIISCYSIFSCILQTFIAITFRTAMFWLRYFYFITLILLVSSNK